jgi:hypothetical protein
MGQVLESVDPERTSHGGSGHNRGHQGLQNAEEASHRLKRAPRGFRSHSMWPVLSPRWQRYISPVYRQAPQQHDESGCFYYVNSADS